MFNYPTLPYSAPAYGQNLPAQIWTGAQNLRALGINSRLHVNALRPHAEIVHNALLRKDEWQEVDAAVLRAARSALYGIQDLMDYDLVHELGGLGTIISTYETATDLSDANIDMRGDTQGEEDRQVFTQVNVPIPLIHKDFRFDLRFLEANRQNGGDMETTHVESATRKVAEAAEKLLFNGTSAPTVGSDTIYGYTNHPNRNTGSAAGDFGTATNIYPTITNMMQDARDAGYDNGPYGVYVASAQYAEMQVRYTDGSGETPMASLMNTQNDLAFIKRGQYLTAGSLVLVTLSREVVDLALAQDVAAVQWTTMGGFIEHFKVLGAMAPRVKSDGNSASGIVHYTGA